MKRLTPIALACVALVSGTSGVAQSTVPSVRDSAGMFSADAVRKANDTLQEIYRKTHWQVVIETVPSLDGVEARKRALANLQSLQVHGLYVLMSKSDHRLEVQPSKSAERAFPANENQALIQSLVTSFRAREFDRGLLDAVAQVRKQAEANPDTTGGPRVASKDTAATPGVRDHAKMFTSDAVRKADETLQDVRRKSSWQVVVETVVSLDGQSPKDRAIAGAKASNVHGLYVLISKGDHKSYMEPSESARRVFTPGRIKRLSTAMTGPFRNKEYDRGLLALVDEIRQEAAPAAVTASAPLPVATTPAKPTAPAPIAQVPAPAPPAKASFLPILIVGGIGLLVFLWLLGKVFGGQRRPAAPPQGQWQQSAQPSPAPSPRPAAPQPGYAPAPGYGPAPGYPPPGYGPPPPQGGGGFMSGLLGGAAGAVAGNILYDKFGRPHHPSGDVDHEGTHGSVYVPPTEGHPAPPPQETYDPNAGVEGDWGDPQAQPSAPADEWAGAGGASGDWSGGAPAPAEEAAATGDWGSTEPAPDPDTGASADWGGDAVADTGGGGDWGADTGGDAGGGGDWGGDAETDTNQGGNW